MSNEKDRKLGALALSRREWLVGTTAVGVATLIDGCASTCSTVDEPLVCSENRVIEIFREAIIERINEHRCDHDLQELEVDSLVQAVGQVQAEYALANQTLSHWQPDGLAYLRYSVSDGIDAIAERVVRDKGIIMRDTRDWVNEAVRLHDKMLYQTPPYNASRLALLKPEHNRVGVGVAYDHEKGLLYVAEEFTSHYVSIPSAVLAELKKFHTPGEEIEFKGALNTSVDNNEAKVDSISVYWEPFLAHVSDEEKERRPNAYPSSEHVLRLKLPPRESYPDGSNGEIELDVESQNFEVKIPFNRGTGIYTIGVWLENEDWGRFLATNIAVKVDTV